MRQHVGDTAWALRVRTEQVRLIYRNYPFTLSANFALSLLVLGVLWGDVAASLLLGWCGCSALITLKGAWDYRRYRRDLAAAVPSDVDAAFRRFAEVAWCTGLIWGGAGLSPFLVASGAVQQVVFPAITGMAFGGAAFLAIDHRLFLGYILPMLGLTLAGAAGMEDGHGRVLGAMTLALAFATLAFAHNVHAMIQRSLVLRFENMDLIDALKSQKEQADYANLSKSRFLAAASHDLRQPMHALGLLFESLRPRVDDPASQHLLGSITATIHTLEDLFNALLDISKLDAGVIPRQVQAVSLQRTLAQIEAEFRPAAERKGLRFTMSGPRAAPVFVRSDPALLERLLRNLVSNAIQHTPRGTILVACRYRADGVRVEVRDSGPGIAPELHKEVFQEFYQIHNPQRDRSGGVGLGLAIVQRLSRMLNHPVTLRSSPGRGSTFAVDLPRTEAPVQPVPAQPHPAQESLPSLRGRLIAAIDDDAIVLESMRELFEQWGCILIAAASAEELLVRLKADGVLPEVVLSDYRLRDGETGDEAIAKVVAFCARPVPGVLVTGDTAPERLREASRSGHIVLHKPVRPSKLRALLLHLLESPAAPPPTGEPKAGTTP